MNNSSIGNSLSRGGRGGGGGEGTTGGGDGAGCKSGDSGSIGWQQLHSGTTPKTSKHELQLKMVAHKLKTPQLDSETPKGTYIYVGRDMRWLYGERETVAVAGFFRQFNDFNHSFALDH